MRSDLNEEIIWKSPPPRVKHQTPKRPKDCEIKTTKLAFSSTMLQPVPSSSPSPSSDHYHRAFPYALIRLRHSNLVLNRHHAMVFLQTPNQIVIVRCTYAEADTTTMQPNPSISDDESIANRHFQIPHWNEEAAVRRPSRSRDRIPSDDNSNGE